MARHIAPPITERLDQYVVRQYPNLSRSYAHYLIANGHVSIGTDIMLKPGYKLRAIDEVTIDYDPSAKPQIPQITLPILYEDDDCVVINKPIGILSHSKGVFNPEATVASWAQGCNQESNIGKETEPDYNSREGIVHRLDRATSGVMIVAKHEAARVWLQKQFSKRNVKKTYIAIVSGILTPDAALIDMPIERNPKSPQSFRVGPTGRAAQTEYTVLRHTTQVTLVELRPKTGRTHQLRVHLQQLGHPIVGDTIYGGAKADRLFLHALRLEVTLPNHTRRIVTAELPAEFTDYVKEHA